MRRKGFTLIELLVVLAIIGILASLFGSSLVRSIRTAEVRDATTQFAAELRRARSLAQRGSTDRVVVWQSGKVGQYTIDGVTRSLANNVRLECIANCGTTLLPNTLTYSAPYGELTNPPGTVFRLSSAVNGVNSFQVRVAGLTGKVIVSGDTP